MEKTKRVFFSDMHMSTKALAQTVAWYRANEAWWRAQMWMRHIPIVLPSGKKELH